MGGQLKPVTVAIPCGNGERYIEESIRSVLAQTYPNLEVFVFDQLSTDRTLEIARSIDDPRLTVKRNTEFLSIGANWNQGFRYGRGPYIIIHHQDDLMAPDSIARKVAFLDEHPSAGFVYSRVGFIDAEGKIYSTQREWFSNHLFYSDHLFESLPFFISLLLNKNLICCPSVLFRRDAALAVGGFNEQMEFTLDWEMWLRMAVAYPVGYVNALTTYYRFHPGMDSAKHHHRLYEHHYNARKTAVDRSAELIDRWSAEDVLNEIILLVRQIEVRSPDPSGLNVIVSPAAEAIGKMGSEPLIRELIGDIRHPKDQVTRLCCELLRLEKDRASLCEKIREYEDSSSFRLGQFILTPVRWVRKLKSRLWRI